MYIIMQKSLISVIVYNGMVKEKNVIETHRGCFDNLLPILAQFVYLPEKRLIHQYYKETGLSMKFR